MGDEKEQPANPHLHHFSIDLRKLPYFTIVQHSNLTRLPCSQLGKNTSKTFLHCYVAYNASFFKKYGTETLHHNGSLEAIMHQWECIRSNQKVFSIH